MSKIKIINAPTNAKLVKPKITKEYIRLTEEANEKIKEARRDEAKALIKARNYIARSTLILIILILLVGCGNKKDNRTLDDIIKENNYIIVDVRTQEEYNEEHIVNAINIPYDQISNNNLPKDKTILVYCRSGARSNKAYKALKKLNYDVVDLGAMNSIKMDKEKN